MSILWTIIIGFLAGVIAKFIMPGDNEPSGFILTAILGIVGAFVATYLGQALGWYGPGEGAGLIGAVVGAVIVLFVLWDGCGRASADDLVILALKLTVEVGSVGTNPSRQLEAGRKTGFFLGTGTMFQKAHYLI